MKAAKIPSSLFHFSHPFRALALAVGVTYFAQGLAAQEPAPPTEAPAVETAPSAGANVAGLQFPLPDGWQSVPPASQMRAAQWEIREGENSAEVVFFFFGKDQGGSVEANLARWIGQFREPAEQLNAQRAELQGARGKIHLIQAVGTFNASMPGQALPDQPETKLIGAVVEGAEGNVFVKFTGPAALVNTHEKAFLSMLGSAAGVPTDQP